MRVNWRRGLFRIWVIASILWIGVVIAFGWQAVQDPYVGSFAFIEGRGDTPWAYSSTEAAAARKAKLDGTMREISVKGGAPGITYFTTEFDDNALTARMEQLAPLMVGFYAAEQERNRPNTIIGAGLAAIVPPIVVLILGAALFWALSGFRRTGDAT